MDDTMHHVEVVGSLDDVSFPELCARCAAPPAGTLPVEKMFRHAHQYSDAPTYYVFATVRVPFCRDCLAAHARERRPVDPGVLRALRNSWIIKSLPYVFPAGVALFFLWIFVPLAVRAAAAREREDMLIWLGVSLFFALLLWIFTSMILRARWGLIADYQGDPNDTYIETVRGLVGGSCIIPRPPTPTLAAVNFTDDISAPFDPDRRTFTFTNAAVATAFASTNAELRWDPHSARARRGVWMRRVVIAGLALLGLWFAARDLLAR